MTESALKRAQRDGPTAKFAVRAAVLPRVQHRVLVADDHDSLRELVAECLSSHAFQIELASDGVEAWQALERADAPRIAILDWSMPGMDGVEVCRKLRERNDARYTYILLMSARSDQEHIKDGLSSGADDFIRKPFDIAELVERVRAGCRVVERDVALQEAQEELRAEHASSSARLTALSMTDELTGLHNRRGFVSLAEERAQLALERGKGFSVVFMDLDGLKGINDQLGHEAGDQAIREASEVLRHTMRDADILARLGGDEFVALLDCAPEDVDNVFARLTREIEDVCSAPGRRYRLSLSTGAAYFEPSNPQSIERLLDTADHKMYQHKRERRSRSNPIVLGLPAVDERQTLRAPRHPSSIPPARSSLLPRAASHGERVLEHLLNAWSERRRDGAAHAQRLIGYCEVLASVLGLSGEETAALGQCAALHDIGELALPEAVLNGVQPTSPERRLVEQRHTHFGAELLSAGAWSLASLAASVARHHHERWDGSGYPDGLVGEACPREARIIGMLDAYDDLRHPSDGRSGLGPTELADYFRYERARAYDPALVDALLDSLASLCSDLHR